MKRIYSVNFIGRKRGAIGIVYPIDETVQSDKVLSDEQILLKLYDNYEHISKFNVSRVFLDLDGIK